MKFQVILFLTVLVTFVTANWSPEDYEIFSLNDKVKQDLGDETTFYSWLGLSSIKATTAEINKAYRKLSRNLHPDKAPRVHRKQAEERFQRLSLVGNILKDQSLRKRYDYFLAKGFPKWKGTGYFYSKFRPGFVFTITLLFLLVSGFHYASLAINRKQDIKRIVDLKLQLKNQAWGGSLVPPSDGSDRKVYNELNGKTFIVAADGNVYLEDNSSLLLLNENSVRTVPHFKESFLFRLPAYLWNISGGKITGLLINTEVEEPVVEEPIAAEDNKLKKKKKSQRGDKIELPNGKVIYGRSSGQSTRRK